MHRFILVLVVVVSTTSGIVTAVGRSTVTNEDIRDAILQVVNVVRATEDKLERHEYRERMVGEQLKKGMISIDKRIKMLEPFKGTINRLDQRLAAVETILMQKDEREKLQLQKTFEVVEDIQKNLPVIVEKLKGDISEKLVDLKINSPRSDTNAAPTKQDMKNLENELGGRIDKFAQVIKMDLDKIKEETKQVRDVHNKSSYNLDAVKHHLSSSEQLLEKYESKLAEYNNLIPQVRPISSDDQHLNMVSALETQKNNIEQMLSEIKTINDKMDSLPEKVDFDKLQNSTIVKFVRNDRQLEQIQDDVTTKHSDVVRAIVSATDALSSLERKFSEGLETMRSEIDDLGKVEQVMVQTADSVLDTKRRVEYGVHQIMAEMQQLIKSNSKDVNAAISERFDTFEMSILDEDTGALANLTAKIGQEIDQVWRQIGIMHQQMSSSADTLSKLQNQTDFYVSGSLNVMDSMKGKVGTITSRITEVDDNLNYLMGKLSLVTQEFNQIKAGLGKALDEMRATYKTVKEKVNKGAGPHSIEEASTKK